MTHSLQQHASRGLALVAILWLVVALGLAAVGLAKAVRSETRIVSASSQALAAQALADGALHLSAQALKLETAGINRSVQQAQVFLDQAIPVEWAPLTGWIDINQAPPSLLAAAIERLGQVDANTASQLVDVMLEARRQPTAGSTQPRRLASVEDLLRLPGWTIDLWSRVAPVMVAHNGAGGGGVNPLAAPLPVLSVLAEGNTELAQRIHAQVLAGDPAVDTTGLNAAWLSNQGSRLMQATMRVEVEPGRHLYVKRQVDFGGLPDDGLSWRIIHESVRAESVRPEPVSNTP